MASLQVSYESDTAVLTPTTLALVRFGVPATTGTDPRQVHVALDPAGPRLCEHWCSALPVRHGRDGDFAYAENRDVLFAQISVNQAGLADMRAVTRETYAAIARFVATRGYPHLLRMWNYFHDIHHGEGDDERYRQFVAGRYEALAPRSGFERSLPAATAIGTASEGMLIYFLASKIAGTQIENPRQTSAFQYPRDYGPRSPSFSRATLVGSGKDSRLLVSGTASIVGHASLHPGDALAQLDEIIENLKALLKQAGGHWRAQTLKLYLRDAALAAQLLLPLRRFIGDAAAVLALQGDICRSDLLVEIEGVFAADARD